MTFQFSFVNENYSTGTATVVGIIRGLDEDSVSAAATSASIISNPDGFGIGEYVTSPPAAQPSAANCEKVAVRPQEHGVR